MVTRLRSLSAAALVAGVLIVSASAQTPESNASSAASAPANLAYVEGAVDVVLEGVTERADPPMLLLEGDVVRTGNGRAEVVFGDGTILHLSNDGELEVLGPEHLRLLSGRLVLRLSHAAPQAYVVDTPTSSVRMDAQGEYGITSDRLGRLDVTVSRGSAVVGETPNVVRVRGGEMVTILAAGSRPLIQRFNSARWDAFTQWAYARTNGFATSQSAHQLPYELRPYAGVLDQHGRWDYVEPHGNVWFPAVSAAWRPYYDGSWSFTRYGWTWSGRDRFAWPTHHYGRWGFNGAFWYWIPATGWGPAWVSWGYAPGYVSWAPLGWDGRPAIRLWHRGDHPAYAPGYSPWRGWTVMPRDHFRPRGPVRAHAVDGERLDDATLRAMVVQNTQPVARGEAVPRDSVTIPGGRGNVRRAPATGAGLQRGETARQAPAPSEAVTRQAAGAAGYVTPPAPSARGYGGAVRRATPAAPNSPASPAPSTSERDRRGAVREAMPRGVPQNGRPSVAPVESPGSESRRPESRPAEPRAVEPRRGGDVRAEPRVAAPPPRSEPRTEPRTQPGSEPRTQSPPPAERGGAVPRGGARSAPSTAAPPASQPRPSGGDGGARRRPPA